MPRKRNLPQDQIKALAARHRGAVRVSQLVGLGMLRQTVTYRCRPGGPWQRILRGVVLLFSGPPGFLQRVEAALLYAGAGAVVTGIAALRIRGFRDLPADRSVHVLIPHRRRRMPHLFVVVERTRRMPRHTWLDGIPCAPVPRAVIDATRRLGALDLVRGIVAEAVQRDYCSLDDLVVELGQAQIWGTKLPRRAIREVMAGVRSVAEAKAREAIRRSAIPEPLWNHDVYDSSGRWLGRPDAIWPELGVVLEIDSRAWHFSPYSWLKTQARQRRMVKYGLLAISVSPIDMSNRTPEILAEIEETLFSAGKRTAPRVLVKPAAREVRAPAERMAG